MPSYDSVLVLWVSELGCSEMGAKNPSSRIIREFARHEFRADRVSGSTPPEASAFLWGRSASLCSNLNSNAHLPLPTAFHSAKVSELCSCTNGFGIFSDESRGSIRSSTFSQSNRRQRQERNPPRSEEPKVTILRWCTRLSSSITLFHTTFLNSLRRYFLAGTTMRMMGPIA